MCRLFGMTAGRSSVRLKYWLASAPDSLVVQSHRNPDGTGIGWFDEAGEAHLRRDPRPAFELAAFRDIADGVWANTAVTHIRAATTGQRSVVNCHPFLFDDRLMAHNGGFGELGRVEAQLGDLAGEIAGQTDSERYAALVAKYARDNGGDVAGALSGAANWLAANVPMYSLNTIVVAPGHLWALRYPAERALHLAHRRVRPGSGAAMDLAGTDAAGRHRIDSAKEIPMAIVASERIDGTDDWRMLEPGELVHIGPDLRVDSRIAIARPPAHKAAPAEQDRNDESA